MTVSASSLIRLLREHSVVTAFEYTITDDDGDASTATVYLTIDAPIPTLLVDETVGQQADPKDTVSDRVSSADFSGASRVSLGRLTP